MDQANHASEWIRAYLDWNEVERAGGEAISAADCGATAANCDFPAVYLEWLDSGLAAKAAPWASRGVFPARRASDVFGGSSGFHEAVLLAALHTETDCLHLLRQTLDGSAPNRGTVRLATEALEYAHRLLDDERSAWRVLNALGGSERRRASDTWRGGLEANWPDALENVAADVQALTGKVLQLRAY